MRILAVRLGAMGDILHTLPAVATVKAAYPDAHLTWAVEPKWVELLEGNPYVDRIAPVSRRGLRQVWRSVRELRRHGDYQLALDFQGLLKSALVAVLAGSRRLAGFESRQVRERAAALFYNEGVDARAAHVVDRAVELAQAVAPNGTARIEFPLPPGRSEGELPSGGFVLTSPLAGWASKQWPIERYSELAALLRAKLGLTLVVNGPPAALPVLREIRDAWPHASGIAGLIHATRRALAVVGVDSGPLHLAAAIGRTGVAVFGPTDPARNGPYGGSFTVLRSPSAETSYRRGVDVDASMRAVTSQDVLQALVRGLP